MFIVYRVWGISWSVGFRMSFGYLRFRVLARLGYSGPHTHLSYRALFCGFSCLEAFALDARRFNFV